MPVIISFLVLSIIMGFGIPEKPMKPVDHGSKVKFNIKNFGIPVTGSFNGLQGIVLFDPENLAQSQFDVSVDVSTIHTGINVRDVHLKRKDYFDVKDYPRIRFRSIEVYQNTKAGNYSVRGLLTIKSVTREISFPFNATPHEGGFLFTGSFSLNRKDYDVGGSSISLSDFLTVSLQILSEQ